MMLAASSLAGCSEGEECPLDFEPAVDFELDLEALRDISGCDTHWDPLLGTPCAAEVPVALGRRGRHWYTNEERVVSGLTNGMGLCVEFRNGSSCRTWLYQKTGCKRDVLEKCKCQQESTAGPFCNYWICAEVEVAHHTCWEAEWDASWELECDTPGFHPSPLSATDLDDVFSAAGFQLPWPHAWSFPVEDGHGRRRRSDTSFLINGSCYAWGNVDDISKMPSRTSNQSRKEICENGWRRAWLRSVGCFCMREREDGLACQAWQCNKFDADPDRPRTYYDAEQSPPPQERLRAVCTEGEDSTGPRTLGPGTQCGAWRTEEERQASVGVRECRNAVSCTDRDAGDTTIPCGGYWVCTSYEIPKVSDVVWAERFWLAVAHFSWMTPLCIIFSLLTVAVWLRGRDGDCGPAGSLVCSFLPWGVFIFLIYAIAFLRADGDKDSREAYPENTGRAPGPPVGGLFIAAILACGGVILVLERSRQRGGDTGRIGCDSNNNNFICCSAAVGAAMTGGLMVLLPGFADVAGLLGVLLGCLIFGPFLWCCGVCAVFVFKIHLGVELRVEGILDVPCVDDASPLAHAEVQVLGVTCNPEGESGGDDLAGGAGRRGSSKDTSAKGEEDAERDVRPPPAEVAGKGEDEEEAAVADAESPSGGDGGGAPRKSNASRRSKRKAGSSQISSRRRSKSSDRGELEGGAASI